MEIDLFTLWTEHKEDHNGKLSLVLCLEPQENYGPSNSKRVHHLPVSLWT